MSYLDDLKKKAQAVQSAEQTEAARKVRLEEAYREQLVPKMKFIFSILNDFIENIKVVQPEILVNYEYKGFGVRKGMRQGKYQIFIDSNNEPRKIHLKFQCEADDDLRFELYNNQEVERQRSYFFDNQIQYRLNPIKDERQQVIGGIFIVSKLILIDFIFAVDIENSTLLALVSNFDGFTKQRLSIAPDKITDQFLDNMLKYIVRDSREFVHLEISEEERSRIRENLRKQQSQKQAENKLIADQANKEAEDASRQQKEKGLAGKLFGLLKKDL